MFCPQQEKKIQMAYNITYHPPTMQYWVSSTGSLTIIRTWAHLALATHTKANCCISVQGLHPLEEHLKANYVTTPHEGCPNLKPPPNAAFFSLVLEDAPLLSFLASHIPRFFVCPKKKKDREKMAASRGVDHHFRGPGRQKSWRKGKTSGDATRKCSKG